MTEMPTREEFINAYCANYPFRTPEDAGKVYDLLAKPTDDELYRAIGDLAKEMLKGRKP